MKKSLIIAILFFLINSRIPAWSFYEKDTDIVIVRNKEKLEKYSKLFAKFIPNHFIFDDDKNLIYYSTGPTEEHNGLTYYLNNGGPHKKQGDALKIIEEYYNSDLDFNIYAVVQFDGEDDTTFDYFRISADINDKSYGREGKFSVEMYFSNPGESLICFFGIVSNTDCLGKPNFFWSKDIDIKLLQEYLQNDKNATVKYNEEDVDYLTRETKK